MLFQLLALAILALFYGCYFAKKLAQRRQGIQTSQIGRGKTGLALWIELLMGLASLAAPLAELVSIWRGRWAGPLWLRLLGAALAALGTGLFYAAVLTMKDSWRAGVSRDKTRLVTEGIFRRSRNPAFLGFDLVYLGLLLLFFNLPLCLISALAILLFHLQIVLNEEPAMVRAFGEEYLEYRRRVRRYWGRI